METETWRGELLCALSHNYWNRSFISSLDVFRFTHSVQFSHSVVSDSLRPHGLQHTRLPCPSPTPGACSNSCPLSQWCHPTISSCHPFSSCPQSFPASGSFPVNHLFTSGGQSIGVTASALVLPVNIQDWFPLKWTGSHIKGLNFAALPKTWAL